METNKETNKQRNKQDSLNQDMEGARGTRVTQRAPERQNPCCCELFWGPHLRLADWAGVKGSVSQARLGRPWRCVWIPGPHAERVRFTCSLGSPADNESLPVTLRRHSSPSRTFSGWIGLSLPLAWSTYPNHLPFGAGPAMLHLAAGAFAVTDGPLSQG